MQKEWKQQQQQYFAIGYLPSASLLSKDRLRPWKNPVISRPLVGCRLTGKLRGLPSGTNHTSPQQFSFVLRILSKLDLEHWLAVIFRDFRTCSNSIVGLSCLIVTVWSVCQLFSKLSTCLILADWWHMLNHSADRHCLSSQILFCSVYLF